MPTITTTDPDTIRRKLLEKIKSIVPRRLHHRDVPWKPLPDGQISGTLRNFDAILQPEEEVPEGFYGGGIEMVSEVEIRVSYPVSEAEMRRFVGYDGQDLASMMAEFHTEDPGVFPVDMRGELPIFEREITGGPGSYVVVFRGQIRFFASDEVTYNAG